MRYRWKLLIILLMVAIIPPLALRTFGVIHLHKLGNELIRQTPLVREPLVNQLISNQFDFSLYLMLAMILIAAALAILFSRTVTKRLRTLTQGVRHLAAGHFHTRVDIRSRDEFGELGRVFNTIGPLLEEHVRVEHSMALATEVQRSLLPQSDPEVPGLDVSGSCIYCDRVGGDYYDYLIDR